jgi:preprotein translocase subunit SecG
MNSGRKGRRMVGVVAVVVTIFFFLSLGVAYCRKKEKREEKKRFSIQTAKGNER